MEKEQREYVLVSGYGRWATGSTVNVECVEQRGRFYASMNTLNASRIGEGDTPDAAFDDWARQCNATRKPKPSRLQP